jgi:hypothetical protein
MPELSHARNGGEKEIGHYKVDGYYENENGQKYVLEFNGKFWHGCLHCYNASTVNPLAFPLSNVDIPLTFQVSFLLYGSLV